MKFESPDAAVAAYVRQWPKRGAGSPSIVGTGRSYAPRCAKARCRRTREAEKAAARLDPSRSIRPLWVDVASQEAGTTIERCAYCMAPRPYQLANVFGAHVGAGRTGQPPAALIRAGDLAPIEALLERMCEPLELGVARSRVYVYRVASQLSYDRVAIQISDPEVSDLFGGRRWSGDDVERAVRNGRAWLGRRLQRAGLLAARSIRFRSMGGATCRTSEFSR